MTVIYSLSDPITNEIRYVGKTVTKVEKRYAQHIYQWKRSSGKITHVNSWIKSLASKKLKPVLGILDEVEEDWAFWEKFWIIQCRSWGSKLCNHTLGGEGTPGYKMSEEAKQRRNITYLSSEAWKEKHKKHSEILKQKHAEGLTRFGYSHLSEEVKKEIGSRHSKKMKELHAINPYQKNALITSRKIPVIQVSEDGKELMRFESASDAARYYNLENTHVTRVCKGKSKSGQTHGYYFKYDKPAKK